MTEKLIIDMPIVVEGKYDKIKLDSIISAPIITTKGFGIFSSEETKTFLREVTKRTKIIILTDSDSAGRMIRNHLRSFLCPESMINLYIPEVEGKEKRKASPSKEGTLGVEGIDADMLRKILSPYARGAVDVGPKGGVTKLDLYEDGLTGGADSAEKRAKLSKKLGIPRQLSATAFLDAINMLCTYEEYKELLK